MFWKPKSPLNANDENWQIECWRWLHKNLRAAEPFQETKLVLPTRGFFPATEKIGHAKAQHIFSLVAQQMDVPVELFELVPQEGSIDPKLDDLMVVQNAPMSPAGTFQIGEGAKLKITYDPNLLSRPVELIATFAHELCHPILMSTAEEPPGGDDCEEFATDLAVTFFGFGVFGANSAFAFEQYSDAASGTQGWSTRRMGYLTEAEWGFSLAMFLLLSGQSEKSMLQYLKNSPALHFRKSLKYLRENMDVVGAVTDKF